MSSSSDEFTADSPLPKLGSTSYDSSDEDPDLPALPAYLSITPNKGDPDANEGDDVTPPLSQTDSVYSIPVTSPQRIFDISPITVSHAPLFQSGELENAVESKQLKKNLNRISKLKENQEREEKIEEIEKSGGILAISKKMEENISEVKKEMSCPDQPLENPAEVEICDVDIPVVPGIPFFINSPEFFKSFLPFPDVDDIDQPLLNGFKSGGLRNFSCVQQLIILFNGKQCMKSVFLWLIENACLSDDITVRYVAYNALVRIASISSSLSSTISGAEIKALLSKLGASFFSILDAQSKEYVPLTCKMEELLLNSVANFCKSLSVIFEKFGSHHSDPVLVKDLVLLLCRVALDPAICSNIVCDDACVCLQHVVGNVNNDQWKLIEEQVILEFQHVAHHQNCHFLVGLMSSSNPKLASLQCCLARSFLAKLCLDNTMTAADSLADHDFANLVVRHYIDCEDIVYGQLLSSMKMLAIFIQPPRMKWNAASHKREFISLLSLLANSIKDNLPGVVFERGPVKDFIIGLKLELEHDSRGEIKQMSIFDYMMEEDKGDSPS